MFSASHMMLFSMPSAEMPLRASQATPDVELDRLATIDVGLDHLATIDSELKNLATAGLNQSITIRQEAGHRSTIDPGQSVQCITPCYANIEAGPLAKAKAMDASPAPAHAEALDHTVICDTTVMEAIVSRRPPKLKRRRALVPGSSAFIDVLAIGFAHCTAVTAEPSPEADEEGMGEGRDGCGWEERPAKLYRRI